MGSGAIVAAGMPMPGPAGAMAGPVWLPLLILGPAVAAYALAVVSLTRRGDRWPPARSAAAGAGFALLTVALMPPLDDMTNFASAVAAHLLMAMLAPLALALGAPVTLALRTLPRTARRRLLTIVHSRLAAVLTLAPAVLILDVGGMYAYYLSPLFAAAQAHPWLHVLVHVHMFLAGCLLSAYLVGPDPMPRRPSTRSALIVLVIAAGSHDLLAKLMYAHLLPHGAGSAAEVRVGAQVMFYGGDVVDLALALALMSAWYARGARILAHERRRAAPRPRPGAPVAARSDGAVAVIGSALVGPLPGPRSRRPQPRPQGGRVDGCT